NQHRTRRLDCRHVFHLNGKMMKDFRGSWESACKVIGKPGLLFHDLRRSGIRNMIRAGIPERVAMAISGHKTRSVFDRYNIVSQEDLMQAANKRQAFTRDQSARLQNGYNRPREIKKVTTLRAVTN
ncbi:MAG: tyrosine-type recombinase/integrase, partial [Proteobacteria bacterium]|nr:tyrosine-type recombinase/integrase [Pseudomonadota bacterium]